MPLIQQKVAQSATGWSLWHITESEEQLRRELAAYPVQWERFEAIRAPQRRLEWLACRLALFALLEASGTACQPLHNLPSGIPCMPDSPCGVSLSHSFPFAAAALHPSHNPGIDIEHPSEKIYRIRHKFLNESELKQAGTDIRRLAICWAAKEALYKHLGEPGVIFSRELLLSPFPLAQEGRLQARIQRPHVIKDVSLRYYHHQNLIICHTV
jgi:4'-phosphopantetheinyl transferase